MRSSENDKSLSEINSSVKIPNHYSFFKRLLAFIGPAYLVSVGYMDPGNWATDIAGGSKYGYALIWVLLLSNLMAVLFQSLSARLGIVTGKDLAQACRAHYNKAATIPLWILSEIAIIATDLAEVLGSAIGLQLMFHIPLKYGVVLTALDTFFILYLHKLGIRKLEALVTGLISIIGLSFLGEILLSKPDYRSIAAGFLPRLPDGGALFIAAGMLGATLMPHNLYLHSSLVQSRSIERSPGGIRQAIRFNLVDSVIALNLAFLVNSAILVLAASVFHTSGNYGIGGIQEAHRLLEPLLGSSLAPMLFGIALIASGQSSTITGTLSGQIVMEGFVNIRLQPWVRRLVTRLLAVIPALAAILLFGNNSVGNLLILSQVVLSLQLPFAVLPLLYFTGSRATMGEFTIPGWMKTAAGTASLVIIGLNIKLVLDTLAGWMSGGAGTAVYAVILPVAAALVMLLLYIILEPYVFAPGRPKRFLPGARNIHGEIEVPAINQIKPYKKIALALDFSSKDAEILSHGVNMAKPGSTLLLMHVVESVGAKMLGHETVDNETVLDIERINRYAEELKKLGVESVVTDIGYGHPASALSRMIKSHGADIAIFGSHGHKGLADLVFGTTTNKVKHDVPIPILIAR